MAKQISSGVIYRGPSLIDGKQIVVIGVYPEKRVNRKTGAAVQTYILRDNENKPSENNKTGEDAAICGNCKHKGTPNNNPNKKNATGRTCYVQFSGVHAVWRKYNAGGYPTLTANQIIELGCGRFVRMGSYGDPLAAPYPVWQGLLADSVGHACYTHQDASINPSTARLCIKSADSIGDLSQSARTFRIIPVSEYKQHGKQVLTKDEILCPATIEGGNKTNCQFCGLCNGQTNKGKSIAVVAHGIARNLIK